MITYLEGNLFESSAQVITNTVNCVGVMGKGVALEFKNRYPAMFSDYQARCQSGKLQPGVPYLWENDRVQVLNFPTKRDWRNPSRLEDIADGLRYLANHYDELGIQSIAMPALGCGNGGLNWATVKSLIETHLGALSDLDVYVYEPKAAAVKPSPASGSKTGSGNISDEGMAAQGSLPL
jgi:O-acetyl-ADP-ribose deacetylase (regulator of RNase III)